MEVALPSSQRGTASIKHNASEDGRMLASLMCLCPWTVLILLGWNGQPDSKSQLKLAVHIQTDSETALLNAQTPGLVGRWEQEEGERQCACGNRENREGGTEMQSSKAHVLWASSLSPTIPQSLYLPTLTPSSSFVTGIFQNQFIRRGQIQLQLEQLVFVDTPAHLWAFREKRKNGEPWAWNLMQSGCLKKKKRKPLFLGLSCLSHHDKANHLIQTEARERAQCSCQRSLEKRRKNSFHVLFLLSGMLFPPPLETATQLSLLQGSILSRIPPPPSRSQSPLACFQRTRYHLSQLWFYSY